MHKIILSHTILQVETVGPEGEKLLIVVLVIAVLGLLGFLLIRTRSIKIRIPGFRREIKGTISKNRIYHPGIVSLTITNNSKKAIVIENPVLRFRRFRETKAFKIKSVNTSEIYPLYLEAGKTHKLPVSLQPFYDFNKRLKKYPRVRIEWVFNEKNARKTRYVLLKPTLFRKEK